MRRLFLIVVLTLVVAPLGAQPAGQWYRPDSPAQPWGTWYWVTDISAMTGINGTSLSTVITFHEDGTLACAEGNSFGGFPGAALAYSTGLGTWERERRGTFKATRLGFVFDKATGVLKGIGRSRFTFQYAGHFDEITGTLFVETLPCSAGPMFCPDPFDPDAVWTPASPPTGFPATARRVYALPIVGGP
jgi:hypothetical protein